MWPFLSEKEFPFQGSKGWQGTIPGQWVFDFARYTSCFFFPCTRVFPHSAGMEIRVLDEK